MFCRTSSRACAISETRASRAVWKGVGGGRVDAIFSSISARARGKEGGKSETGGGGGVCSMV